MKRVLFTRASLTVLILLVAIALVGTAAFPASRGSSARAAVSCATALRAVYAALERRDVSAAIRVWHDAYVAALESRQWEPLLEVGVAYLRVGDASRARAQAIPKARALLLDALFRARQVGSTEGVLRVGEQFAVLGDAEMARAALRTAAGMARDPAMDQRVHLLAECWFATRER